MLDPLRQDIRYAVRTLFGNPGFSFAAIATLALGIGATTAVFSVVDGVLLRPVPFRDMDRLMVVWETDRHAGTTREPSSVPDFFDFRERSQRFDRLGALSSTEVSLTPDQGDPSRVPTLAVTHDFLPMVGVHPLAGRTFSADDDRPGAPPVALISEWLWTQVYSRDPAAVGRTLRLDGVPHVVVGVLPTSAGFGALQILDAAAYGRGFAERGGRVRVGLWLPLGMGATSLPRDTHPIIVMGRLRKGATVTQAQQEMGAVTAELEQAYPANRARGAHVEPLSQVVFGPVRPVFLVLLGAVALLLLAACTNVANLLLVRALARVREVTLRAALGAGRGRLARQFLVEGAVLVAAGAALGLLLARVGLDRLRALAPPNIPRIDEVAINLPVLGVTLALSTAAALAFALIPMLHARRADLHVALQGASGRASAGREHARLRSALVVTELALAVILLAGSGLLIRSLWRLQEVDAGFSSAGVFKAEFQLPPSRYPQGFKIWPHWTAA
jgi:putative ABC transport system permease protein